MAIIVTGTIIAAANAVATVSAQSNSTTPSEDFTGPSLFEDKATPIVYWFMIFLVAALPAFRFLPILPEEEEDEEDQEFFDALDQEFFDDDE